MPSFTKAKDGGLKLTAQTDNPDQAAEKVKRPAKPATPATTEPETT